MRGMTRLDQGTTPMLLCGNILGSDLKMSSQLFNAHKALVLNKTELSIRNRAMVNKPENDKVDCIIMGCH
jgi:hypothetical protein